MGCRVCGTNARRGKYCVECGATTPPRPYLGIAVFVVLAGMILLLTARFLSADAPQQTNLKLTVTSPESCAGVATIFVQLDSSTPVNDAPVAVYINGTLLERLVTDQNGRFFTLVQSQWCEEAVNITARYDGDRKHQPSEAQASIRRSISCSEGLIAVDGACVSRESRSSTLIARLQKSIVKVQHPDSRGSGVIIEQTEESTFILTNKHVIDEAKDPYSIKVYISDGSKANVRTIYVAPDNMDLAVIELRGKYGMPAQIEDSQYEQGNDVVALGSPHGIQGSVSKGIISNFGTEKTTTKYQYKTVQTDAAINKGNSGGGLFLESTGKLIGINSFKMKNTEGLNFAIDMRELDRLPHFLEWKKK